ncbi:MAG: hypothetical protein MHPSP_003206 [Paramarteilia canceri]
MKNSSVPENSDSKICNHNYSLESLSSHSSCRSFWDLEKTIGSEKRSILKNENQMNSPAGNSQTSSNNCSEVEKEILEILAAESSEEQSFNSQNFKDYDKYVMLKEMVLDWCKLVVRFSTENRKKSEKKLRRKFVSRLCCL